MADIFLSYASTDCDRARHFAEHLSALGHSVWWDRTIPPGRVFDEVIQEALDAAKCVVVLWSAGSVRSNWVKTEASVGMERKRLLPVLIEDVTQPIEFRRIQAANLASWTGDPEDPEFANLVASIQGLIKGPQSSIDGPTPARFREMTSRYTRLWPLLAIPAALAAAFLVVQLGRDDRSEGARSGAQPPGAGVGTGSQVPATRTAGTTAEPLAPAVVPAAAARRAGRVNLIAPENGGQLLVASAESWAQMTDGKEDALVVQDGIAVYGFKNGRAATFGVFTMLVPTTLGINIRDFELSAGNEGPTGHFDVIGRFSTQNVRIMARPYQEFQFTPVTAKYFKFHPLRTHDGSGAMFFVYEIQLFGTLE